LQPITGKRSASPLRINIEGVLLLLLFILFSSILRAQTDTISTAGDTSRIAVAVADTVPVKKSVRDTSHSVRKATILSAILPGAGQIYNRKAWKVPIVYAAFAGMGYLVKFNHDQFRDYENALLLRFDNDPSTVDVFQDQYSDDNLRSLSDFYRRNRDLSVVGMVLIHVLNIIDAHVDAHLYNFDISDDLSLRWQPALTPINGSYNAGFNIALQFK
jgi:hypothetical protein